MVSEFAVRTGTRTDAAIAAGRDGATPLRVEFDLRGIAALDGQTLHFQRADGQTALSYSGLLAWDADGKTVPAQMILAGTMLCWVVQDKDARYPLTIDPWVQQQKLTASDGATNGWFGSSVALSGDISVVDLYVFVRSENEWTQQQKLAVDYYSGSVALSGDTIVVGADAAVYVFTLQAENSYLLWTK